MNQVFDGTRRQHGQIGISCDRHQPVSTENDITQKGDRKLGCQHPPEGQRSFIEKEAIDKSRQHGVEGETWNKSAFWFDEIFEQIHRAAEKTAYDRPEQIVHKFIGESAETDFQIRGDADRGERAKINGHGAKHGAGGDGAHMPEFMIGLRE